MSKHTPLQKVAENHRLLSANTINQTLVKAGDRLLQGVVAHNTGTIAFIKLYNLATAPAPANVAQVTTITLTGTSGTANVTVAGGLTKLVTFNTDLATTASDFDTDHSAAYTAEGITVTTSGDDIIFTAASAGTPFDVPVITNATGDLAGTVVETTDNQTLTADPVMTIPIAATTGQVIAQFPAGISFSNGIAYSVTGAIADNDATAVAANQVTLNIQYS